MHKSLRLIIEVNDIRLVARSRSKLFIFWFCIIQNVDCMYPIVAKLRAECAVRQTRSSSILFCLLFVILQGVLPISSQQKGFIRFHLIDKQLSKRVLYTRTVAADVLGGYFVIAANLDSGRSKTSQCTCSLQNAKCTCSLLVSSLYILYFIMSRR